VEYFKFEGLGKNLFVLLALLASACSSDDDKKNTSSNFNPPQFETNLLVIDANNRDQAVGDAIGSSNVGTDAGSVARAAAPDNTVSGSNPVPAAVVKASGKLKAMLISSPSYIGAMDVGSSNFDCTYSGYFSFSYSTSQPSDINYTPSINDRFTLTFNGCSENYYDELGNPVSGAKEILNGSITYVLNAASFNDLSVNIDQLSDLVEYADGSVTTSMLHGDFTVAESLNAVNGSIILSMSGSNLYFLSSNENFQLVDFDFNVEAFSTHSVVNATFGVNSSTLGGHLDISYQDVTTYYTDLYPSSGKIVITAANTELTLDINSNTQVTISEDIGKDGTTDSTEVVAWSAISVW